MVSSLCFSPDGKCLATGDDDRLIKLWDTETGEERAVFSGHSLPVTCLDFAPDGGALASASNRGNPQLMPIEDGGEVRIWNAALPVETDHIENGEKRGSANSSNE